MAAEGNTSLTILRFIQKSDDLLDLYQNCYKKFMEEKYSFISNTLKEKVLAQDQFASTKLINSITEFYLISKYCEARFINIYYGNTCEKYLEPSDIEETEQRTNKEYWNKNGDEEYPVHYSVLSYYGILCNLNSNKYRIETFVDEYFERDLQDQLLKFSTGEDKPAFFYKKNDVFTYKFHKEFLEVVLNKRLFKIKYQKMEVQNIIAKM
jgi:hypothetical protein